MADTSLAGVAPSSRTRSVGQLIRQREASLILIMVVGAVIASVAAPQFLSASNISNVASLASIAAVAAVGQALVVITRSIDLSVEAVIGLVAYLVAVTLEVRTLDASGDFVAAADAA